MLPFKGGMYIFNLMDYQLTAGLSLLVYIYDGSYLYWVDLR